MEPLELRSHNRSVRIKLSGDCSNMENSPAADSSVKKETDSIEMDYAGEKSGASSKFTDLDDVKPKPVLLNSSIQIKCSLGDPKDPVTALNSDKTGERPKEKYSTPLITFSRRAKKKWKGSGRFGEQNSNSEGKHCSCSSKSGHVAEASCTYLGSSPVCRPTDHSASAKVLLVQAEVTIEFSPPSVFFFFPQFIFSIIFCWFYFFFWRGVTTFFR